MNASHRPQPNTRRRWARLIGLPLGLALLIAGGLLAYLIVPLLPLPTAEGLRQVAATPSTRLLDREGRLLYAMPDPHKGFHQPVALEEIPLALRQAVVATEDATFYTNPGVNLRAIVRATWQNLRAGRIVSGASTITQQTARNLMMGQEARYQQDWRRKAREALLALYLTATLSKDEVLQLYLNETEFGNMALGVEAAALGFYGKPVGQLDLAECALLAGLPQAPSHYNPLVNLEAAKARQRIVLDAMVREGTIDGTTANLAHAEPLYLASAPHAIEAPHYCMAVRAELIERLGAERVRAGGLVVHTTLDLGLQHAAEEHMRRHIARLAEATADAPAKNARNAAVVVMDPDDGAIRAMVGSPDYFSAEIAGAVNGCYALRQPGSAIKPLTYAAAFARGLTPATMVCDVPGSYRTREGRPFVPLNYDLSFHGPVSLRRALACSYNVVAVEVLDRIGIEALTTLAHEMGITSLTQDDAYGLSLTLGAGEVPLVQLAGAYACLANGGYRVAPRTIARVEDADGHVLYKPPSSEGENPLGARVLDSRIAYLVTDVLADNEARAPAFGEYSVLRLPYHAAVKTGTTTEWRDNWTVGYTTEWVVGVWVGNADNAPMVNVSGVDGAAPIWHDVMMSAHRVPPAPFERPDGLIEVAVCTLSGQRPGPACHHVRRELFLAENAPRETCDLHQRVTVDAATGRPPAPNCPPERLAQRDITLWPPEALDWAREQGFDTAWSAMTPQALGRRPGAEATPGTTPTVRDTSPPLALAEPHANSRYLLSQTLDREQQRIAVRAVVDFAIVRGPVELWIDGALAHIWHEPPHAMLWPLTPGEHAFYLVGHDAQGNRLTSETVYVDVGESPNRAS